MGFSFGTKAGEAKKAGANYIRNFAKGETKVRFLQETDDFTQYFEHFLNRISFPCTGDRSSCPGCTHEDEDVQRASRRYATHVWLVDEDRAIPVKLGPKLFDRLTMRAERNDGTLMSRDYIIIRTGQGLTTDYDIDQDSRYEVNIDELRKQIRPEDDIQTLLLDSFKEHWGSPEQYQSRAETRTPRRLESVKEPKPSKDDDAVPETLLTKAEREQVKDEDVEITEEQLKSMSKAQLRTLYRNAGWGEPDDSLSQEALVDIILAKAE